MSIGENRNVYVGHRYVPKIMGEWDNSNDYEGLSIVTYKGSSYTSKKRVPVGIDISNEEYWVVTGNYDSQVENYRQEVRLFDGRITDNTDTIEDTNTQLGQTNTQVEDNTDAIEDTNTQLGQTNTQVEDNTDAIEDTNTQLGQTNTQVEHNTDAIETIEEERSKTISVVDYGALGDGVTDDTVAIQTAIDSMTYGDTLIFPVTSENKYIFTQLIVDSDDVLSFTGTLNTELSSNHSRPFIIKRESIDFSNFKITNTNPDSEKETIVFNDERDSKRLDFDLSVKDCNIMGVLGVVATKGRGVEIENNSFSDVADFIIELTVLPRNEVEEGSYDIQKYELGYRNYLVRNNRFHYLNSARIMRTLGDDEKVVNGVTIIGNLIEGGLGYFKGYVRNLYVGNNNHFHDGYYPPEPFFDLDGGINIRIDVSIEINSQWGYVRPLLVTSAKLDGLTLTGNLEQFQSEVLVLNADTQNIYMDMNVRSNNGLSYVKINSGSHDGFVLKGIFYSTISDDIPILYKDVESTLSNKKIDLTITGWYDGGISNFEI